MNTNTDSSTGVASDSVGGTFSNDSAAPSSDPSSNGNTKVNINPNLNNDDGEGGNISAGYDNNVPTDQGEGTGEGESGSGGKKGILGKVKEAFKPKPGSIGRTENEDLTAGGAAAVRPDGGRHEQANTDLNRE